MEYIAFLVLVVTSVLMLLSRVRQRFQSLEQARDRVAKELDETKSGFHASISIPASHPLSEEQIKDMAENRGFTLEKPNAGGGTSSTFMQFRRTNEDGTHG
ncbi:hypothetical protein [Prauserella rugosa]|uniref:Uncharacterized protein n=1 Tax=Prauserella rugosa TaxID=43354 RepID=A0A660CCB3_9PSEU|nr:hypothetical protein [Prauserella rugosa]KMS82234.1 hypothetical protein ACZ91_59650 [Streptomyces regensis]TWH21132.1 hypothetical protein JD82_02986 [Prauserella rugosa]